jgi:predicted outer membrane repeat protein
MYLRQGTSLTISDSIFEGNSASPEQHASGGAVALGYQTTVQLIRCRFVGNSAERGGAIYVGTAMPFRSLTITDCSGSGNTMPGAAAGSQCGAVYWFGAGKDCNDQNLGANGAGRSRNEEESSGGVAAKKAQVASRWDEISLTSTHHSVEKPPGCLLSLPPHTRAGSCVEDLSLRQSALSGSDAAGDVTSVSIPPAASAATATANGGGGDDDDKQQPGGGCNLACDAGYFLRGSETPMCRTTAQGAEQPLYLARWAGACAKPS